MTFNHGVTKRCRLSLLTNSALVIRVQLRGGGGVEGPQPMSTAVHITWNEAQINLGDLPPYLTYVFNLWKAVCSLGLVLLLLLASGPRLLQALGRSSRLIQRGYRIGYIFIQHWLKWLVQELFFLHCIAGDDTCNVFCAEIQLWLSSNKLTERDWVTRWMTCMDSYWPK